jgi:glutathione S-transferase
MKLMYSPGACSIGIHVLLEEIGKPYETQLVNLREGAQYKPEFTTVNPKSKVPTLVRDDGSVLTEYPAIAYWLARTNPEKKLLPDDVDAQARALEALDYAVATVHMQGFGRLFRAANFTPNPDDEDKVKERGRELAEKGCAVLDKALAGKDYLAGSFSIADSALFMSVLGRQAHEHETAAELRGAPQPDDGAARGAACAAAGGSELTCTGRSRMPRSRRFRSGFSGMARPTGTPRAFRRATSISR